MSKESENFSIKIENKYLSRESLRQILKEYFSKNNTIINIYGEFKLTKKNVGSGGTSSVKEFEFNNKKYAIKFLLENIAKRESRAYKRFKQAHLNLLSIQHTGVILPQMHLDKLIINENIVIPYIVMPIVDKTLKAYIKEKKKNNEFDFNIFEKVFKSLLEIIETIHRHNIIHRDIKPENIFILDHRLVLGDFDIAKFDRNQYTKLVETKKDERLANFHFSAPEQVSKDINEIGFEADWYAFGQIIYWMITGKTLRGQAQIIFPDEYRKYEKLVKKLLSENPKNRPKNKDEILKIIDENEQLSSEDILWEFENIIFKYMNELGLNGEGIKKFNSINDINEIMWDLSDKYKSLNLWWSRGISDNPIRNIRRLELCEKCWLFGIYEIKIKAIWIFKHHYNLGCSLIIIETDKLSSTNVYNKVYEEEEVGLFEGKYIDIKYLDTGWAIIDGKRINLKNKAEVRVRVTSNILFFVAPQNGPIITYERMFEKIIENYRVNRVFDENHALNILKDIKKPWSNH
jgi:serine/threonine-protein kinase